MRKRSVIAIGKVYDTRGFYVDVQCNEARLLPFISTAVQCPELVIDNGTVKQDVRYLGYTARYSCMEGYRLIGDVSRTCLPSGNWSNEDPICEGRLLHIRNQ